MLLNPGTTTTPTENFGWNWEPALDMLGIPWCAYTAPNQALGRIDVSGEYLAYAIRTVYKLAGRKIAIVGHSQGGMSMRWALRFWPDTRSMVEDIVGIAADNHGTTVLPASACKQLGCVPADWQQLSTSNFIRALNSRSLTFAGISYTELYTIHDEVSTPASGPNALHDLPATGRRTDREHRAAVGMSERSERARPDRHDRPGRVRAGSGRDHAPGARQPGANSEVGVLRVAHAWGALAGERRGRTRRAVRGARQPRDPPRPVAKSFLGRAGAL